MTTSHVGMASRAGKIWWSPVMKVAKRHGQAAIFANASRSGRRPMSDAGPQTAGGKVLWDFTMSLDGFVAGRTTRWTG
jgi:hypothetical protein